MGAECDLETSTAMKSANLPGSRLPMSSCMPSASAPPSVAMRTHFGASSTVTSRSTARCRKSIVRISSNMSMMLLEAGLSLPRPTRTPSCNRSARGMTPQPSLALLLGQWATATCLALRMRMSSRLTCTQWTARKSASKTSHCCRYLMGLTPKGCTSIRSGSGKFAHDFREKMGWERMLVQPFGVSPIKYLQQWDVFDADFLAVHCVQVSRDDIRILKAKDVAVAHCPKSNAKLGCGVMPLADLLHEGVRVGLGTDSPASSNIMDMFDEMRTMLFLHRAVERDVTVLDAPKCVRIATLGGAEALGMQDDIGSLEPGKFADFIAVDVSKSHFAPIDEPYSALVYGANQDDVLLTVVGGDALFHERGYTGLDAEAIRRAAFGVREKLRDRVRAGSVQVGAAESGWWQTSASDAGE